MRVLLVRPVSPNERFGLGPFFRVEPLGLEYIASALIARGHDVRIADLRFGPSLERLLRQFRPSVVGIASLHVVDVPSSLDVARRVKRWNASTFTLLGGHAVAVAPDLVLEDPVDAVGLGDGEQVVPALVDALSKSGALAAVPGLIYRARKGNGREAFEETGEAERVALDEARGPARNLVATFQHRYHCVHKTPLWAIETTRGCPYRCAFCSIWRHHGRTHRLHSLENVCRDFEDTGPNIFVVDDLFWHPPGRSLELAKELGRRGVRKDWILVQSRLDTVAKHAELLEAWRPLARQFDIFFGFESPSDRQLEELNKDMRTDSIERGVLAAREVGYGVTGNFVVDPQWGEADFEAMWALVDRLGLERAGFTVLTPLPGTPLYDKLKDQIVEQDWTRFDMHHLLYEPKLGRRRFFELFVESWRRNVLSAGHARRKWLRWMRELSPAQAWMVGRLLLQTQRMLRVDAYLGETFPLQLPAQMGDGQGPHWGRG